MVPWVAGSPEPYRVNLRLRASRGFAYVAIIGTCCLATSRGGWHRREG